MRLEFHPEAERELVEEAAYYEIRVPGLGGHFEEEVRRATSILLQHPEIGVSVDADLRKFVLNRFPYSLYYSFNSEVLYIEVVAHQSRRPGYWKSRTER